MAYTITISQTDVPLSVSISSELLVRNDSGGIVSRMNQAEEFFVPASGGKERAFFCDENTTYVHISRLSAEAKGLNDYQLAGAQAASLSEETTDEE